MPVFPLHFFGHSSLTSHYSMKMQGKRSCCEAYIHNKHEETDVDTKLLVTKCRRHIARSVLGPPIHGKLLVPIRIGIGTSILERRYES